jgi:tRNA dimethylallyltransferase
MLPAPFQNAFVLTGPTGSGKTQLALELAERLGAEVVSMDSMALYRGMDIGTAKPTAEERRRVPQHLVDVLDPWESASVAWWLRRAADCCRDLEARGKRPLFVGGTPLYLKALLFGLFDGPPADEGIRQRLTREAEDAGPAVLHERLARVDPVSAARLHPNDVRRVVRALEVWELTGKPLSRWQQQWPQERAASGEWRVATRHSPLAPRHSPLAWLDLPRAELYDRINRRVEQMFAAGLVEEVRALRALPRPPSREAAQALGYKEVFAYLDGRASLAETVERVRRRSRNFAKRQVTWFRHLPGCCPVNRELTGPAWASRIQGDHLGGTPPSTAAGGAGPLHSCFSLPDGL